MGPVVTVRTLASEAVPVLRAVGHEAALPLQKPRTDVDDVAQHGEPLASVGPSVSVAGTFPATASGFTSIQPS